MSDEKSGYVYFLSVQGRNTESIIKIGMTKTLPTGTSNPENNCRFKSWLIFPPEVVEVSMLGYAKTSNRREAEKRFHSALARYRVPYTKEFFQICRSHISALFSSKLKWIEELSVEINWIAELLYYDSVFQCFKPKTENKPEEHKSIRYMHNGEVKLRKIY